MAAFLSRTVDGTLRRGSRRAALNQFWTVRRTEQEAGTYVGLGLLPVGLPASDGEDIWAPGQGLVWRYRASDVRLLETWTASAATAAMVALGRVFVTGNASPGVLYTIFPSNPPGAAAAVATNLGDFPNGLAFDGAAVWTANTGSVSMVTIGTPGPYVVSTVTTGFGFPTGALYDGVNVWVTDNNKLLKLGASAAILQTVTVGAAPLYPIFDGANIWVPNSESDSVSVVRASNGVVLATLTGNGLSGPHSAAFDGQRILVTNSLGESVSLWKAADLTSLGTVNRGTGFQPFGACSDGISFFYTFSSGGSGYLSRFE
jgi:hypothetical protein